MIWLLARRLEGFVFCRQNLCWMIENRQPHQVGCWRSLPDNQNAGERADDGAARTMGRRVRPRILIIRESVVAPALIRPLNLKHLE